MRRPLAVVALCALLAVPARATVVLRASVEDLTDRCHRAVLGSVTSRDVTLDRAAGQVWTVHGVRVEESWLGEGAADVAVSVPGGEAEGVTQDFEGGARLAKGARVALFLWRDEGGRWLVLGEAQGAFDVRRDAATGADVCVNSTDGLVLVDASGRTAEGGPTRITLDAMRSRVAAARRVREDRERRAREARERVLEERRRRAERHARETRGKPGGAPAE